MKQVTAGVLIQNNKGQILGCIPFGKGDVFDIPKGHVTVGEDNFVAAIREVREETSIELKKSDIKFLGQFHYNKYKDLALFYHHGEYDVSKLNCSSLFTFYGREVPEMIGYKWIDITDIENSFYKSLGPILTQELKKLNR